MAFQENSEDMGGNATIIHVHYGAILQVIHYYTQYFTGWFLDIKLSKVHMNMYPEGLPYKVITIRKCQLRP
jgi:hypothetical protein